MTIPEILKALEPYTGHFPMKPMRAAIEQREAITPELLRVLEQVAENPCKFAEQERITRSSLTPSQKWSGGQAFTPKTECQKNKCGLNRSGFLRPVP